MELISNGGFETEGSGGPTTAEDWTFFDSGSPPGASGRGQPSGGAGFGTWSAVLQGFAGNIFFGTNTSTVRQEGITYNLGKWTTLKFYARSRNGLALDVQLDKGDGSYTTIYNNLVLPTTWDGSNWEHTFLPTGTTGRLLFRTAVPTSSLRQVDVDGVSIVAQSYPPNNGQSPVSMHRWFVDDINGTMHREDEVVRDHLGRLRRYDDVDELDTIELAKDWIIRSEENPPDP